MNNIKLAQALVPIADELDERGLEEESAELDEIIEELMQEAKREGEMVREAQGFYDRYGPPALGTPPGGSTQWGGPQQGAYQMERVFQELEHLKQQVARIDDTLTDPNQMAVMEPQQIQALRQEKAHYMKLGAMLRQQYELPSNVQGGYANYVRQHGLQSPERFMQEGRGIQQTPGVKGRPYQPPQ